MSAPTLIRVPAETAPAESLSLDLRFDGTPEPLSVLVELGRGSRASLVVRVDAAEGAAGSFRSRLDLRLADGAALDLFLVSDLGAAVERDAFAAAVLGEGAVLRWTEAVFDAGAGRSAYAVELAGRGSRLDFAGAYGAAGRTKREHSLDERHRAPGAVSRALLKSALRDSARLSFKGLIHVEPGAPGTDAYLSNRNLLLDDGARADSLPQLRIETDDVACTHGSTTGGPREEEVFYLSSRGLDRETARSLLTLGHLSAVLDRLPPELAAAAEAAALRVLAPRAAAEARTAAQGPRQGPAPASASAAAPAIPGSAGTRP